MNNTSRIFKWLDIILLTITIMLGLQATYIVIIGGTASLFWFSIGLVCLTGLSNSVSSMKRLIASIIFFALALYFILAQNFLLMAGLLWSYIAFLTYPKYLYHRIIKTVSLLIIIILFYVHQQTYFEQLKHQYKLHDSGETWQQSGAL